MKLTNDRIVDIAFNLRAFLEGAIKDIAGTTRTELMHNIKDNFQWQEAVADAKITDVIDLNAWFIDYLSEDMNFIFELLHDRILDYVEGDYRNAIKIAHELSRTADEALKAASIHLYKKWQKHVEVLVICVHCGRVLKRVGEAESVSHGDCLSYFGPCNAGEDYHRNNADLLGRTYEDYVETFGPKDN